MNVQYISDSSGKTTGVYIPISEWNALKEKFKGIEEMHIPEWQILEVRKRIRKFNNKPESALDLNEVLDELDKNLDL